MQENNVLIAEFMGMVYDNHNDQPNKYWELTDEQDFVSMKPYPQHKDLQFHSNWNWLMVVVEKIESIEEIDVEILTNGTRIFNWKSKYVHVDNSADISYSKKIEHTYDAVVKFLRIRKFIYLIDGDVEGSKLIGIPIEFSSLDMGEHEDGLEYGIQIYEEELKNLDTDCMFTGDFETLWFKTEEERDSKLKLYTLK